MEGEGVKMVRECLEKQVMELELLYSMYRVPEELSLIEISLDAFKNMVTYNPLEAPCLEFVLRFSVDASTELSISFFLSKAYPEREVVDVYIRSDSEAHSQAQQLTLLTKSLRDFIKTLPKGEPQTLEVIQWIQSNYPTYCTSTGGSSHLPSNPEGGKGVEESKKEPVSVKQQKDQNFCRIWFHSHHIYSKEKRKNMIYLAKQFCLSGFCLPGKPGAICVEGCQRDVESFSEEIRGWTWKKLTVKEKEIISPSRAGAGGYLGVNDEKSGNIDALRRFSKFEEKIFEISPSNPKHMDMKEFRNFLSEAGCEDKFFLLLGLEQKNN